MVIFTSNWLILFPLAFSLFVALQLSLGRTDSAASSWMVVALRCLILFMFSLAFIAFGTRGHFASIPWLFIAGTLFFILFWKLRNLERRSLLMVAMTGTALRQQKMLVDFYVAENRGWMRRKSRGLQKDLDAGLPFAQSLEARGVARGIYERLALRLNFLYGPAAGDRNARPPEIKSSKVQDWAELEPDLLSPLEIEAETERAFGRLLVFAWVLIAGPAFAFILAFILPTLRQMLNEFDIALPASVRFLVQLSWDNNGTFFVLAVSALPMLFLGFAIFGIAIWIFPSLLQSPGLRWLCRDYHENAGFLALSRIAVQTPNLASAFRQTAEILPVQHTSRKFARAATLLEQGQPLAAILHQAKLLSRRSGTELILSTSSPPQTAIELKRLAASNVERMLLRYSTWVQCLVVGLTLALGLVIGWFAYVVIVLLSSIVNNLA